MEALINFDHQLFELINSQFVSGWFTYVAKFVREAEVWIPLYLLIAVFLLYKFKKNGFILLMFCVFNFLLTENISSHIIKKNVQRARPCHLKVEDLKVDLKVHCGSGFSFTSTHASNHMGIAMILILSLGFILKHFKWIFLLWAGVISYSQVYVGVHYPSDVIAGMLLGALLSISVFVMYRKWVPDNLQVKAVMI